MFTTAPTAGRLASEMTPAPRSLVFATDIDVLALDRTVTPREGYLVVRSPSNPTFWYGNFLLFDEPPAAGDRGRWERLFEREFADAPRVRHRTFGWDRADGETGAARAEFGRRGYELESDVGLVATPEALVPHPRANRDVEIRPLDPSRGGADEPLWSAVVELQVAGRDERIDEREHREFSRLRQDELRALFAAGRGAWYVALSGDGELVASCGIVATGDRGRFQAVETADAHRRKGLCSRLVVDAAAHAAAAHSLTAFVIVADAGYHALGLYESLGFRRRERVHTVCRPPRTD
jgi:ribosomal protein S18 acetylase RimI-like enzyme